MTVSSYSITSNSWSDLPVGKMVSNFERTEPSWTWRETQGATLLLPLRKQTFTFYTVITHKLIWYTSKFCIVLTCLDNIFPIWSSSMCFSKQIKSNFFSLLPWNKQSLPRAKKQRHIEGCDILCKSTPVPNTTGIQMNEVKPELTPPMMQSGIILCVGHTQT